MKDALVDPVEALILDLLQWIDHQPRTYQEVIDAWRTSCPRLPVWEEATERGFIEGHDEGGRTVIVLTTLGRRFLVGPGRHRSTGRWG